jgi:uncharacterized cupredoxin-like copper-binding protein
MEGKIMTRYFLAAIAAALVAGATSVHAEDSDDHGGQHGDTMMEDGHHGGAMMMTGEPGVAEDVTRTVAISMVDNFFEPEGLTFTAGETIRFTVTNDGGVVHEFNIGTAVMHAAHQEEMAMMVEHGAVDVDHINHDMMNMDMGNGHIMSHDDPNSILLEPGQTGEVIWKFTEAVALEFACNMPGHYESGMMGDISVNP